MSNQLPKWDDERTQTLENLVMGENPVSAATVHKAADELSTTSKSIAAKLRRLGYEVASLAKTATKSYTDEEEQELRDYVEANPKAYTYGEIAEALFNGERSPKQIQGKLLSMELTRLVKPSPKKETQKTYSEEEEQRIITMMEQNAFLEDIAEALGRPINSIRGKALSLANEYDNLTIPKLRERKQPAAKVDPFDNLDVAEMTVEDIAETVGKTLRGVKAMLTHRALKAKNYDGAKRAQKNKEKRESADNE